ncbi:FAD-binding oxidoreductase [Candidatus Saccharibacteria bacterium]|nr:FAD-binding oxidoreductase [Candidatus Saccharibacteria bacterium]
MGKITKYLNQLIVGNVFDTPEILEAYSTDRSILKIKPKFVAFPESTEDIRKLMRFFNQIAAKEIPVSVTARGAGLDEGGADLSSGGLVISTEKLNRMLEIDPRERLVRVQAGITLRELNTALSVSGLTIPISGHDNDTIGGLISNTPVDDSAGKYGGIESFVERVEVILANGECLQTSRLKKYNIAKKATEKSLEGDIYRKISKLLKTNTELVSEMSKNPTHDYSGYPAIAKLQYKDTLDLMPLFFGAQGTLGVISEVILKAVPLSKRPSRVVATFRELDTALEFAHKVKSLRPRKINFYDLKIIQEARESGKNLDGVIRKLEDGFVVPVSFDERINSCVKKVANIQKEFSRNTKFIFEAPENRLILNEFENALAAYLNSAKSSERVPILTDFYLPARNVGGFLKDLKVLEQKLDLDLALFGSYATSIYSLRPKFNLEDKDFNKKAATFLRAGAYIIDRQDGKLAGGTPEGRLKAVVTNTNMKDAEQILYSEVKRIFDQNNILNPDVKLGANSKFTLTHFRSTSLPKIML